MPRRLELPPRLGEQGVQHFHARSCGGARAFRNGDTVGADGVWRSLVSALVWGTRGPRFKSGHPDTRKPC